MKKILDSIVQFVLSLNETNNIMFKSWEEVQLFSNCTFYVRKESEGLNLCSLFDLQRGAFLC